MPATVFHMLSQAARTRFVTLLVVVGLSGCAGQALEPVGGSPSIASRAATPAAPARLPSAAEHAAAVAVRQIGIPYRYGGNSRSGFDCSGLVHYAYGQAGVDVPRTTTALWRALSPVTADELRVGDVLFFDIEGKVSHVGLYLGAGRFVHAPASGREVSVESLASDFYSVALVRGGRPR